MPFDRPSHGLIAILLITRSKSGPKLVFHCPPQPGRGHGYPSSAAQQHHQDSDDDSDDDDDGEHDQTERVRGQDWGKDGNDSVVPNEIHLKGANPKVLGYAVETLEKLLSPGRWSDGKKFEICLDGTTFVGHPVYANEDGMWSTRAAAANVANVPQLAQDSIPRDDHEKTSGLTDQVPDTSALPKPPPNFAHISESLDSHTGPSLETSFASASTTSAVPVEQLSMSHVVFVLQDNTQDDTRSIYDHVAKKLSKALQYCQKRKNYLGIESRNLVALKTKAKQNHADDEGVVNSMIAGSELAWSLEEVYEKIAVGGIADIRLNGTEMSLHIPPQPPTAYTSALLETTPTTPSLSPDSALLLLEDKPVLLRQLSDPGVSQLAYFIREHTPTKPLRKLSARLSISLPEMMALSNHLIKWRKARAIAPLHSRNTYVLSLSLSPSPSASSSTPPGKSPDLPQLIRLYAKNFPALPTLPQMLKVLSGRPIQYGLLIPSKDHRAPYIDILAFLLRFGVVVRLETKGWLLRRVDSWGGIDGGGSRGAEAEVVGEKIGADGVSAQEEGKGEVWVGGRGVSLLGPQLRPVRELRGGDFHDQDDADSARSVRSADTAVTAIPAPSHNGTTSAPVSNYEGLKRRQHEDQPSNLILHPLHPYDDEEEKALQRLISSIQDEELREYMPTLLKYFDGLHALEDIAVAEGVKRARVEEWLAYLREGGWLRTFRAL
ncbi:Nitrogen permease regulator 3 [Recurvomyces mirabilis]|nr:Nitrogen permease regulator 3 [Recurvomyces mirabilis]